MTEPSSVETKLSSEEGRADAPPQKLIDTHGPLEAAKGKDFEAEWTVQSSLQVLGGFMLLFNTWGYINSFGVFQNYYKTELIPNSTNSQISWIGSMQSFLLLLGSALVGRLFDAGHMRFMLIVGTVLLIFTTCMQSLSTEYYQLFLSQGLGSGIAVGILFTPGVACVSQWFKRRRAAALGIVASGSSVGAVIYPIAAERLIPRIGFGWAVRTLALIQIVTLLIPIVVLKSRLPPRKAGPWIEPRAFLHPTYTLFAGCIFFAAWGLWTPFFYSTSFAETVNTPANLVDYVLPIMNAASVFGRILPNFVADVVGPINVLLVTVFAAGILMFGWLGISTWQGFVTFSALYGFFSGTLVSLPPACIVSLTDPSEMSKIGVRMGMVFSVMSFATLTGTPIAGALLTRDDGGYKYAIIFSGAVIIVGGACCLGVRIKKSGTKILKKS